MKQPNFSWEEDDKYELQNFMLEVNNIFVSYNTPSTEKLAIVKKNWLGRKGLQFIESLKHTEKDKCNTIKGLFEMLNKSKPQFNETIKSLQFHKLSR